MKRIIAALLAVFMLVGVMNIAALAEEEGVTDEMVTGNEDVTKTVELEDVELPNAVVTRLNVQELKKNDEIELTYALNFKPGDITEEQAAKYGNWYADYVLTINKEATFNADGSKDGYLAGQYDEWSDAWVAVPFEDRVIEAEAPFKVMETAAEIMGQPGLKITCAEAFEVVQDFDCGVYFTEDFISNNPGLVATIELRIYNPEDESESYPVCDVYEFKAVASTTEEGADVQGNKLTGSTAVEIENVDTTGVAEGTTSVTIDTNTFIDESAPAEEAVVNTVTIPAAAVDTVNDLGEDATLNITLANGEEDDVEVSINKAALDAISAAAGEESAASLTLKVEQAEELESDQESAVAELENSVVYTVSFETEDGTPVFAPSDANDGRKIEIKIPYTKSTTGKVKVYVKFLKDDGTLEDVDFTYDNNIITMSLAHFSEYVIYEKRFSSGLTSTTSGGSSVTKYTVVFDVDGGSAVVSQRVEKNDKVSEPAVPTKEGYTFEGWYTDETFETAYDFAAEVTKGFTLYAKWTEVAEEPEADEPATDEPAEAVTFSDVKEGDWFSADVKFVSEKGLMKGVTETEFAPDELLTRAMLVTILYRNEGEPATNRSIPFADIDMSAYYASAVIWAQQNGIVNGVTETEFAPDSNITREQIAAIMFRYAVYKGMEAVTLEENLTAFADADEINEYAISALNWAVGSDLINGKTESTLCPKDNATRAEIAAILHRYIAAQK